VSHTAVTWARAQAELHPTPKAVLVALAERVKANGDECWPSQKTVAADTGKSLRTVNSALAYLQDQGFITREGRHSRRNGHRVTDVIVLRMDTAVVPIAWTYGAHLAGQGQGSWEWSKPEKQPEELWPYVQPLHVPTRNGCTPRIEKGNSERSSHTLKEPSTTEESPNVHSSVRVMDIEVRRVGGEWSIRVVTDPMNFELLDRQPFQDVLVSVIESCLDEGVPTEEITEALNESWSEDWVQTLSLFQDKTDVLRREQLDNRVVELRPKGVLRVRGGRVL
jgi:hypothetical protein